MPASLFAAPHRALFLLGALQSVMTMLWWSAVLAGRVSATWSPEHLVAGEAALHGWGMLLGLFPFFIFGFLFTALPNWVNGAKISQRAGIATAGLMGLGVLLLSLGLTSLPVALAGLALHALGWGLGLKALFLILVRRPPGQDPRQPWLAWWSLAGGLGASLLFLLGLAQGWDEILALALTASVWAFLVPLFLAVCHRMLPFFTSRIVPNYVILRPYGPLWLMVAASLLHGLLEALGLPAWTWLVDLPLAGLCVWFLVRWGFARTFHEPLLSMLYMGFAWGALAFILYGLDSLLTLAEAHVRLGLAPLHALGIGFFGSLLLAMATRVSLGHSGRPLKADRITRGLFWLVQATALVRMLPDLAPGVFTHGLMVWAGALWLLSYGVWTWRFAPLYWRPRADGKPG